MVSLIEREGSVEAQRRTGIPALSAVEFHDWRQRFDVPANTVELGAENLPKLISAAALENSRSLPKHSFTGYVRELNGDCEYVDEIRLGIPSRSVDPAFALGIGAMITGAQLLYGRRIGNALTWDDSVTLKAVTKETQLLPHYATNPHNTAGYELNVQLGVHRAIGYQKNEKEISGLFIFPNERAQAEALSEFAIGVLERTRDPAQTVRAIVAEAERLGVPCRKNVFLTPTS